jgi:glycosyltransferase involved in cell wall biosynthesis
MSDAGRAMVQGDSMAGDSPPHESWIAVLGRQDAPVDGVEDYCTFLGLALTSRGVDLKRTRVRWIETGRMSALRQLRRSCDAWRGKWVLVQYTALGWSRRGFPFYVLLVVLTLRQRGVRCAIVYHEPWGVSGGNPWIGRIRRISQDWVVRMLHRLASKSIFADPLATIPWLSKGDPKAAFIPIGANIPEPQPRLVSKEGSNGTHKTIAVFCLSEKPHLLQELDDIAVAVRSASKNGKNVRVLFVGRGTETAEDEISRVFRDTRVDVLNLGLANAENVSQALAESDAMLCVRGRIYPRRGSAIAGIACGMPIVGYAGEAEGTPLADAGLVLVPYRDAEALGVALSSVLNDPVFSRELGDRSLRAQRTHFSWDLIADAFIRCLHTQ